MKTLNEVISYFENRTGKLFLTDEENIYPDVLTYLKILRGLMELTDKPEEVLNEPLTWDELKGMEGKPVWIADDYRHWEIIQGVYDDNVSFGEFSEDRNTFGTEWQAYRKERE